MMQTNRERMEAETAMGKLPNDKKTDELFLRLAKVVYGTDEQAEDALYRRRCVRVHR